MKGEATVFVHPQALCESDRVGAGTRVWAFAHVMAGAVVGRDCNLCDHVFVEAGAQLGDRVVVKNGVSIWDRVTIEDDVFVGPNAAFTNDLFPRIEFKNGPEAFLPTLVRKGASIGANATLVCGSTIGTNAFVGAGAVVIDDVPAHALVVGTRLASSLGFAPAPNGSRPSCPANVGGATRRASSAWSRYRHRRLVRHLFEDALGEPPRSSVVPVGTAHFP